MDDVTIGKRCPHVTMGQRCFMPWRCEHCGEGVRVRALSLHNPYPYLILDLPEQHWKNVENRQRPVTKACGPLLLCSSLGYKRETHEAALRVATNAGVPPELLPTMDQPKMSLLGCVYVSDILPRTSLLDLNYRWKFTGHVGYVLESRVKLPPRRVRGGQGIFHIDLTASEASVLAAADMLR